MRMGLARRIIFPCRYKKRVYNIWLFLIVTFSCLSSLFFIIKLRPVFLRVFVPYAVNIGSDSINFTVSEYFNKNSYTYNDFVTLSYNDNNEITSLQTNSSLMNKVKADLSIYLQEEITKLKTSQISIPFGSIFDNIIFHGIGPSITVNVKATDITDLNFNDSFESVGINQVRHKIFIDAYITISINCASMTETEVIHDTIPVCETIIVGDVPQYYSLGENLPIITYDKEG